MANITFYHIDVETRDFIKEPTIYEETTDYQIQISLFTTQKGNAYPVYALHNGTGVKAEYSPISGMGISCKSRVFDYEIDNTWLIYYTFEDVNSSTKFLADIDFDISGARLSVGKSINNLEEYYISNNEDADGESNVSFFSVEINTSSMSDSFFTYGSTFSPSCSIEITPTNLIYAGLFMRIELNVDGVWQNFGVFYIKTPPEETSEYMSISGVGLMETVLSGADAEFDDFNHLTVNMLCTSIKNATGVDVIFEFEDKLKQYPDFWNNSRYILPYQVIEGDDGKTYTPTMVSLGSYREYLSAFAVAFHSNVVERNGAVYVTHADNSDFGNDSMYFDENTYAEEPVSKNKLYFCASPISVNSKRIGLRPSPWGTGDYIPYYASENIVNTTILSNKVSSSEYTVMSYPVTIEAESMYCEVNRLDGGDFGTGTDSEYSMRKYAETIGVNEPFAYYPIDVEFAGYNPFLRAGGTITLKFEDETHYCYLGNVTYSWDGMMSVSASTPCDIDISGNSSSLVNAAGSLSASAGTSESSAWDKVEGNVISGDGNEVSSVGYSGVFGANHNISGSFSYGLIFGFSNEVPSGSVLQTLIGGYKNKLTGDATGSALFGSNNTLSSYFNQSIVAGQANILNGVTSSLVIGEKNKATGEEIDSSIVFGQSNEIKSLYNSMVCGLNNILSDTVNNSIISGRENTINNAVDGSLVTGLYNEITGYFDGSAVFGNYNDVRSDYSMTSGSHLINATGSSFVHGQYNEEDTGHKYAEMVGGGTSSTRKNIYTLDWTGNSVFAGDVRSESAGVSLSDLAASLLAKSSGKNITAQCTVTTDGGDITISVPLTSFGTSDYPAYGPLSAGSFVGTIGTNISSPILFSAIIAYGSPIIPPSGESAYAAARGQNVIEYQCEVTSSSSGGTIIIHTGAESVTVNTSKIFMQDGTIQDFYPAYGIKRETENIDFSSYFTE